jgi:RHS repeat-associated protein
LISLTNSVNPAQEVWKVTTTSQWTNLPQTLVQNVTYTPWGAVSTFEDGCSGSGCANAQESYQYTQRLQPWVISLAAASGAGSCLVYNYYSPSWTPPTSCPSPTSAAPTGTTNNGNVMGYWYQDSVNSSFSHTAGYTYDSVNRLLTAAATGNSTYILTFNYTSDGSNGRYGNMACTQNVNTNGPCPQWTYSAGTNQLSSSTGCTYDAAGNLTKDCSTVNNHAYQWDAEGRVSAVDPAKNPPPPTWSFTYNALGQRVQMVGTGGTQELMYDPNGAWLGIYGALDVLPWGGGYFALYNGTDTYFNHVNNLGSTSMLTNHAGTAVEDVLFYPWGQNNWKLWGSGGYSFADLPYYDTTTDTNLTLFRLQSPGLGRWLSPDLMGGDITNPQSLNRYAYALNNPTTNIDPLGLDSCDPYFLCPEGPWSCFFTDPGCYPSFPPGIIAGGTLSPTPPGGSGGGSSPPAGNPPTDWGAESLVGTGCIQPSLFTSLAIWGGKWAARILRSGGSGQTQSVSWGAGPAAPGVLGVGGVGPSASISAVDTVDIYGNAAQVSTLEVGFGAQVGASVIAGIQLGKSDAAVPTTPQSSSGGVTDPTVTLSGVYGAGLNLDLAKSGAATLTAGYGLGARGRIDLPSVLALAYVWSSSTPYCRGGM